jgi:hypothetical protein
MHARSAILKITVSCYAFQASLKEKIMRSPMHPYAWYLKKKFAVNMRL